MNLKGIWENVCLKKTVLFYLCKQTENKLLNSVFPNLLYFLIIIFFC